MLCVHAWLTVVDTTLGTLLAAMTTYYLNVMFYISVMFFIAKTTGIVTLMGIGLGFGLTAYFLYRVSLKVKKPPDDDAGDEHDEDCAGACGGNGHSTNMVSICSFVPV